MAQSGSISRLRDRKCGRVDVELPAEVERGSVEWQLGDGGPEVELIAASAAEEAVEEVSLKMDTEAPLSVRMPFVRSQQAAATLLVAAPSGFLVIQKIQDLTDVDLPTDRPVI